MYYNIIINSVINRDKKLYNLIEAITHTRTPTIPDIKLLDDPLIPMVESIVKAADKRKAGSISAIQCLPSYRSHLVYDSY